MRNNFVVQLLKYGVVGVMNTLLTAVTIWILMHFVFGIKGDMNASTLEVSVSNTIGYIVGVVNSFILNRTWTFKSKKNWRIDLWKFVVVFLVCFCAQLLLVNLLNTYIDLTSVRFAFFGKDFLISFAYICQLIGIVFYTVMNFLCNKYYTFKK